MSNSPIFDGPDSFDPDDIEFFGIDWSDRLDDGETISSSAWTVEGAASENETNTDTTTRTKISAATAAVVTAENVISTSAGRRLTQTLTITVRNH